jgi:hypothetical protein
MYIRVPTYRGLGESLGPCVGTFTGSLPISFWQDLISLRPPVSVQQKILKKKWGADWFFHRIEKGVGPVNLDYYPVQVSRLPPNFASADLFLRHIRLNINDFIDTRLTKFSAYNKDENKLWLSNNPLGAILHLNFYVRLVGVSANVDEGAVVVSDYKPNYWRVSTIWTAMEGGHPISGNREWGYCSTQGGGYIFYTKAADRLTRTWALPAKDMAYAAQHRLWVSFQQGILNYVNRNGGQAQVLTPTANRYDWNQVAGQYHPTVNWI